jgi:DNA repair protein RecN (Recombination protein N)
MLQKLHIKNFILVDELEVDFADGFCVLSGETGAGKSVFLNSLKYATGAKSKAGLVRPNKNKAIITAIFSLDDKVKNLLTEHGIECEGNELLLKRSISDDGKNKCFINDQPVTISLLAQIGAMLVEIHGQHDQRGLFDSGNHIKILDEHGRYKALLKTVAASHKIWHDLRLELAKKKDEVKQGNYDVEYLTDMLTELEKLDPRQGEEEDLVSKRNFFKNKGKIIKALNDADKNISGEHDVSNALLAAQKVLMRSLEDEESQKLCSEVVDNIDKALIEIDNVKSSLSAIADSFDIDEYALEEVESRISDLRSMARKHHTTVEELEELTKHTKEKLHLVTHFEEEIAKLEKQILEAQQIYAKDAAELTAKRQVAAQKLEKSVKHHLADLHMNKTQFIINIEELPIEKWRANGVDNVAFMASVNPDMPVGMLSKIASGGELSRFMLALKATISDVRSVTTLVFDEIDTGIGGAVADAVGTKLKNIANDLQVMVITHQPQVASKSDYHLKAEKSFDGTNTNVKIYALSDEQKHREIARMLSGNKITDEALSAARKLIEQAA